MLSTATIMAFVATAQPERAKEFYAGVLGLKLVHDEEYALVFDSNSIMLRIQKSTQVNPPAYTALGWKVNDIHAEIRNLVEHGITFETFTGMDQDASGVLTFPDGTMVAWFKDPDGNLLSLSQFP